MPTMEEEVEAENAEQEDDEGAVNFSIPLVVNITKSGGGGTLEFGITALPDEIHIDSLSIRKDNSEDELAYTGPDFE